MKCVACGCADALTAAGSAWCEDHAAVDPRPPQPPDRVFPVTITFKQMTAHCYSALWRAAGLPDDLRAVLAADCVNAFVSGGCAEA